MEKFTYKWLISLLLVLVITSATAQNFKTVWRTTTANESITIPTTDGGYNYTVDWGDGNSDTGQTGNATHNYTVAGDYTVTISGAFPRIYFNGAGDKNKIISIEEWGASIAWTSMENAFTDCDNLVNNAIDTPNLSGVTSLNRMFSYCSSIGTGTATNWNSWNTSTITNMTQMFISATSFNKNIGDWNVSNVTNMHGLFHNASVFNQNIGSWNVNKVTTMNRMFYLATKFNQDIGGWLNAPNELLNMGYMFNSAKAFNQDIGSWNVAKVTTMKYTFNNAIKFNQNLNNWDVAEVTDMSGMFRIASDFNGNIANWTVTKVTLMNTMFFNAVNFNQNISNWKTNEVINMDSMFSNAVKFNQNLSAWNVAKVTRMYNMFKGAMAFDQNIGTWDVSLVTQMTNMLDGVTLSIANYDALLVGWNARNLQNGVTFDAGNSKYHSQAAADARANMIASDGWIINDDQRVLDIIWTGNTNTNWGTASNWNLLTIPLSHNRVFIPDTKNPVINATTGAIINNLVVNANATLTVESGGSLIVNQTSSGSITYKIAISDTNWHLIAAPVIGEEYNDSWNSANAINVSGSGNNTGISTYNNTTSSAGSWSYFQNGGATNTFNTMKGYSLLRTAAGSYNFTGEVVDTGNTNVISLTIGNIGTAQENKWNLIGNPFAAYIKVSNLISDNTAALTDTHEFIYVWNGTDYYPLNYASDYIHPGQAFFVNANSATNFTFNHSLQSHQTGITFYKAEASPKITLHITEANKSKFTEIVYDKNATTGLDVGFDAGTFTGTSTAFNVYTHLVSDSQGVDFMRQALPTTDYENMVIPVGVNANAGKEITFTATAVNLPATIKVFLEDKLTNTFTRLDEQASNYKVTLSENANGIGRFYLHTRASALSTDTINLNHISIYKKDNTTLRITGVSEGKATLKLYNILGKQFMNTTFSADGVNDIRLPNIATGVYMVQLETETGTLNKKIILE